MKVLPFRSYVELGVDSQEIVPPGVAEVRHPACSGARSFPQRIEQRAYRALSLQSLPNTLCLPRQVIVHQGALVEDTFRRYDRTQNHVQLQSVNEDWFNLPRLTRASEKIDVPCFYLDSEHTDHYGHLTLETLSRLWALPHVDTDGLQFVTSARDVSALRALLQPFGIQEHQVVPFRHQIEVKNLLVATQAYQLEGSVNPAALAVWDTIGGYYSRPTRKEKIYVSRSRWKKQRALVNEVEVEDAFRANGFEIIYPETLALSEQISLFRGAKLIAGPSGSNMYNLVYAGRDVRAAILISDRFMTANDALICSLTGVELSYFVGKPVDESRKGMFADWTVNMSDLRTFIREWSM